MAVCQEGGVMQWLCCLPHHLASKRGVKQTKPEKCRGKMHASGVRPNGLALPYTAPEGNKQIYSEFSQSRKERFLWAE
jgi:hypothetical protein